MTMAGAYGDFIAGRRPLLGGAAESSGIDVGMGRCGIDFGRCYLWLEFVDAIFAWFFLWPSPHGQHLYVLG